MFRDVIIMCAIALAACTPVANAPKTSIREITGDVTQRVTEVSRILTKQKALPTAILNAHFVEEQIGDGILGPSDFRAFYVLEVTPQDIPQWKRSLTPLPDKAEYAAPTQFRDWWCDRAAFHALELYKPDAMTGRIHGWIGISRQTGRIYIFTFTM